MTGVVNFYATHGSSQQPAATRLVWLLFIHFANVTALPLSMRNTGRMSNFLGGMPQKASLFSFFTLGLMLVALLAALGQVFVAASSPSSLQICAKQIIRHFFISLFYFQSFFFFLVSHFLLFIVCRHICCGVNFCLHSFDFASSFNCGAYRFLLHMLLLLCSCYCIASGPCAHIFNLIYFYFCCECLYP